MGNGRPLIAIRYCSRFVGGTLTPWLSTWWQLSLRIFVSRINTAIEAIKPVLISFEADPSVSICIPDISKQSIDPSWNAVKKIFLFFFQRRLCSTRSNERISEEFLSFSFFFSFVTNTKILYPLYHEKQIWFYLNFGNTNLRFNNEITF